MEVENSEEETLDACCDVLSDQRRRYLCAHLLKSGEGVYSLDELVERVRERGRDDASELEKHRQRIRLELHHWHLPKLADTGLINYDAGTRTVRYRESWVPPRIRELLGRRTLTKEESPGNRG